MSAVVLFFVIIRSCLKESKDHQVPSLWMTLSTPSESTVPAKSKIQSQVRCASYFTHFSTFELLTSSVQSLFVSFLKKICSD